MSNKQHNKRIGEASMRIEWNDNGNNKIQVFHGTDDVLLAEMEIITDDDCRLWEKLWKFLEDNGVKNKYR